MVRLHARTVLGERKSVPIREVSSFHGVSLEGAPLYRPSNLSDLIILFLSFFRSCHRASTVSHSWSGVYGVWIGLPSYLWWLFQPRPHLSPGVRARLPVPQWFSVGQWPLCTSKRLWVSLLYSSNPATKKGSILSEVSLFQKWLEIACKNCSSGKKRCPY